MRLEATPRAPRPEICLASLAMALRLLSLCLVLLALLPAGCRRDERRLGTAEAPLVVVLSESHGADAARVRELEALLAKASGLGVELRVAPSAEDAVRLAGSPNVDAALLSVFEYLLCRQLHGVSAGLRVVRVGGGRTHLGEIVSKRSGPVQSLSDLAGKKIAFVHRYSSTGYLLPSKLIADAKVSVTPVFTGSHEAALAALKEGRVDAAATYEDSVKEDSTLVVLGKTPALPNEPLFFRAGLAPEKKQKLMEAFQSVAASADGKRVLAGIAHTEGFEPVTDADYAGAVAVIDGIGKSVKDVVPQGWIVSHEAESKPGDLAP